MHPRRLTHRTGLAAAALVVAAALVTGCGGDSDSASTGSASSDGGSDTTAALVDKLNTELDEYRAIPKWISPGEPFDVSGARGKTIFSIPLSSSIPFSEQINNGMAAIAKEFGIKYVTFPNQGQPSQWVQGMDQAIARKVDLIVLNGAPNPAQLQPQLEQAKKAGIPVLATHMDQPWPACEENPAMKNERFGDLGVCFGAGAIDPKVHENLTGLVAGPLAPQAYVEAHYAIAQTNAKLNALIIQSSDIYDSQGIVDILQGEFKKLCPDTCKSTVVDVPVADWATKLQGEAQTALQRDPTINYVIPLFDSMTQFLSPALKVAGRTDVGVVSFNGTPFVLKKVQDGEVTAVLGENLDWIAHASMDQAMRILTGTEQVKDALIPLRVFDKSNASEAGTPPAFDTGYGDAYKAGYRELWKK